MDMTGYIKISCLDIFSWICPQFISCLTKDILLFSSVSFYILLYPKISAGANSQMQITRLPLLRPIPSELRLTNVPTFVKKHLSVTNVRSI